MSEQGRQLGLLGPDAGGAEPRGRGRPAGAMNKRARRWQERANAMSIHPVEFLLQTVAKSEEQLARELQLFKHDDQGNVLTDEHGQPVLAHNALLQAHRERRDAAREVLPYVEQKLPALDEDEDAASKRILMIVGNLTPDQERAATQVTGLHFGIKQNQGVIDADPAKSDGDQSDDAPNSLTIHEDR